MHRQHESPKPDFEIAHDARLLPIEDVAREKLGIASEHLYPYGHHKAKLALDHVATLPARKGGGLVVVTAMTPTPAGEGKTTTTVGLGDALARIGKRAAICLREPSMGPCFGIKGGAAGGGYAQVLPMEDINLHFTGDLHAIGAANNLLAALIDNHIHWGNALGLDSGRVSWHRVLDMNDRALREITYPLGRGEKRFSREGAFDIAVASEVMAIFCLALDVADLKRRLAKIVVGRTTDSRYVTGAELDAPGAMTALLKDALAPNIVQTIEHNPAFIHGGPFANIAHGANSAIATRAATGLADYVVTEAGFGTDLGLEKFIDIKCRATGIVPDCAVLVATVRALKMHGGIEADSLGAENVAAVEEGFANLVRHVDNIRRFGLPGVVCLNRFSADTPGEVAAVERLCESIGIECVTADHWAQGSAGAVDLAEAVVSLVEGSPGELHPLYPDDISLWEKTRTIAREMYGADDIDADPEVRRMFDEFEEKGFGRFPVCIAKTQYSFTTDSARRGAPTGHVVRVREVRISAGAGFVVAICGNVMTMPGLPRNPSANRIDVDEAGRTTGLF